MLFIEKVKSGKALLGPFLTLEHPAIIEICGHAGFDYAIIDTEHGETTLESAIDMVRAAQLSGVSPVVRVYKNEPELICKALDIGAEAVQVPQICSREEAIAAVSAAKYSPEGTRGCNHATRSGKYCAMDSEEIFTKSNGRIAVILQVEGQKGLDSFEDIVSVPGIDVLFIGPYDLSASLGIPGQVEHPLVVEAIAKSKKAADKFGVALGLFVDDIPTAKKWSELGVRYLSLSADTAFLYNSFKNAVDEFK